jgi:hypothetical protein
MDMKSIDPKHFGEHYVEATRAWAAAHPTVDWLDLMAMTDLADSKKQLDQWMADPERFVKQGKIPGQHDA